MKEVYCMVDDIYFDSLVNGSKKVEIRLWKEHWKNVVVGNVLVISRKTGGKIVRKTVASVGIYPSFSLALISHGWKRCIPTAKSLENAISIYKNIPGYEAGEKIHDVVAFELEG